MSKPLNRGDDSLEAFVSRRILELCRKNEKSRYWLAKNSEISGSNIRAYVMRKTLPSLPLVKRICDAFGITLSQFFSQDDQHTGLSEQALEVACLWSGLNLKDRESALRHMQGLKLMEDAEAASKYDSKNRTKDSVPHSKGTTKDPISNSEGMPKVSPADSEES